MGIHPGEVLHHTDHSGVIVSQHIQLQEVGLHGVVFKMGGDGIGVVGVRRVLHRAEVLHIHVVGDHHQAAGMLAGGAPDAHAAQCQAVLLRPSGGDAVLLQIFLDKAVGGLFRQGTDGAGPEHLGLSEHLDGVLVGPGLVFTGEVQVDIRHLAAAEAQEGLKGDIEAVFDVLGAADGTDLVRHVGAAAVGAVGDELGVLAVGAAVVRRQRVDLRDAGHVGNQGRTHGATGAHQVSVFQAALHQLLGGHVHHVVLAQDTAQLHVQPVHDQLGRILAIEPVDFLPHQAVQVLLGVGKPGRIQVRRQQLEFLHLVGDGTGIGDHHLVGLLLPQVGKLFQHFICGLKIDGQGRVGVRELFGGQQDMAVDLVLGLQEVDVAGGADGLAQLVSQPDDGAVELPQLLLRLHVAVSQHESVVAQGLDLQIVIVRGDALELVPVLVVCHRTEQLSRLAGGAHDDAVAVLVQKALGNDGHPLEILEVGGGDHLVEVLEAHLVLGDEDDVLGEAVGLASQWPQLLHLLIHRLEGVDSPLMEHLPEGDEHIAHGSGIVTGPVVVEGRQVQVLRHDVQLVLAQIRQQVLCQDQGVHIGGLERDALFLAACPDEADIELGVVGRQRPAVHELQKRRQGLPGLGGVLEHLVGDAGETHDLRRQVAAGVHEGLEPLADLAVSQYHGADLGDGLPVHLEAGGLDVKADELPVQGAVQLAVNGHPVVDVVDEVTLYAVEDLDVISGGVPGIRERLGHAVVRDGDGGMAPADGGLHRLLGVRQGVHVGHLGVEEQLHPLFLSGVLPGLVLHHADVVGVQLDVLTVPGGLHLALDAQPHTRLDGPLQLLGLLGGEVLLHRDGVGVIRHVKAQPPHARPPGLPALEGKDLALHRGVAHLQIQVLHGAGTALDGLPHEDLAALLLRRSAGCGNGGGMGLLLHRQHQLHGPEAIHRRERLLQRRLLLLRQGIAHRQVGGDGELLPVDDGAGEHRPRQAQPQLSGELELCEHFKKRDISGHGFLFVLPLSKGTHSASISFINASTSCSWGTL